MQFVVDVDVVRLFGEPGRTPVEQRRRLHDHGIVVDVAENQSPLRSRRGDAGCDDLPDGHEAAEVVGGVGRDVGTEDRDDHGECRGLRVEDQLGLAVAHCGDLAEHDVADGVRRERRGGGAEALPDVEPVAVGVVPALDPLPPPHDPGDGDVLDGELLGDGGGEPSADVDQRPAGDDQLHGAADLAELTGRKRLQQTGRCRHPERVGDQLLRGPSPVVVVEGEAQR